MDRKVLLLSVASLAGWLLSALGVLCLIVWPTPIVLGVVIALILLSLVPTAFVGLTLARLGIRGVRLGLDMNKDMSRLARTVGRAAPVLRRIDDRGRTLMYDRPWEKATGATNLPSGDIINVAAVISSKAQAKDIVAAFTDDPGRCDRLILVLDPARAGKWGTWVDDPIADNVCVVAGEHLGRDMVDLDSLFTSCLVYCLEGEDTGDPYQGHIFGQVVRPDKVAKQLGLRKREGYDH